jgi:tetratricopeptide (TPR) repeat protein
MMKAGWGFACAAMILLLAVPRAQSATPAESALSEIAAALSGGAFARAEQLATAALADPGLSAAQRCRLLLDRGLAHERQGAHAEALPDLTEAIDAHALTQADQALALFTRGMASDALGRLTDAVKDYDAAVTLSPHSAPALNNRANAYRRLGRLDDAKRDYLASLAAGNSQPEYPYYGLGQIAEAQGDTVAARGFYTKAVAADPGYRLAAGRLKALSAGNAAADSGIIRLHPPKQMPQTADSGDKPLPAVPAVPPKNYAGGGGDKGQVASSGQDGPLGLRPAIVSGTNGGDRGQEVQLGSWRREGEATQAWLRAVKRAGKDLIGLTPHVVPADLPGRGRYYRLRVSPDAGAAELCTALAAKGLDCLPVRD